MIIITKNFTLLFQSVEIVCRYSDEQLKDARAAADEASEKAADGMNREDLSRLWADIFNTRIGECTKQWKLKFNSDNKLCIEFKEDRSSLMRAYTTIHNALYDDTKCLTYDENEKDFHYGMRNKGGN